MIAFSFLVYPRYNPTERNLGMHFEKSGNWDFAVYNDEAWLVDYLSEMTQEWKITQMMDVVEGFPRTYYFIYDDEVGGVAFLKAVALGYQPRIEEIKTY